MARKTQPRRKTVLEPDGSRRIVDRNANGEGSAYWDASKDRWRATYREPDTGKRRTVLGTTKAAAEARRDAKVAELAAAAPHGVLGSNPTVAQLAGWFLERVAPGVVRPNTLYSYRAQCNTITKTIGDVPVRSVNVELLRIFLGDLGKKTDDHPAYGIHGATNIRARLRQILEEAVNLGYLDTNPVLRIRAERTGSTSKKPKPVLTATQCKALVSAAAEHHLGAGVAMLFTMGNRSSEVLGLAWSDIEMWDVTVTDPETGAVTVVAKGTATVRRGSTYAGKGVGQRLDATKTTSTQGIHRLPPAVTGLLRRHKAAQDIERERAGDAWRQLDYHGEQLDMVFTNDRGKLIYSSRLLEAVRECCELAGVPYENVGTHTGRRSVITALYGAGYELADVARHVGHTQMSTTQGYVQDLGNRPSNTSDGAERLFDPTVT